MSIDWDENQIAIQLQESLKDFDTINTLLTFDEFGVSNHSNHIALNRGVKTFLKKYSHKSGVKQAFELVTVSVIYKFTSLLGVLSFPHTHNIENERIFAFNIDPTYALRSLSRHYSQFVWFRKLFTFWSTYVYFNQWNKIRVIKVHSVK